jgi:hypothetical protein
VKENRINHLCARFDELLMRADSGSSAQVPAVLGGEARQLQTWEDEGGHSGSLRAAGHQCAG